MIDDFSEFRKTVSVIRKSGGAYVNGHWQVGAETEFAINADIQSKAQLQIEVMPEGRHIDYSDVIYTDIKLFTVRDENPDIVLIDGDRYEVLACYEYQHDIINHYRAELKRQEQEL